jgi:hypothetical protein
MRDSGRPEIPKLAGVNLANQLKGDDLGEDVFLQRMVREGTGPDSRRRESSINQMPTVESKLLRCPQVEENARICALFSSFLQRTRESRTGWWSEQDLNFQSRFSSARRQPIGPSSVNELSMTRSANDEVAIKRIWRDCGKSGEVDAVAAKAWRSGMGSPPRPRLMIARPRDSSASGGKKNSCAYCRSPGKPRQLNEVLRFDRREPEVALCDDCLRLLRFADARIWEWFRRYRDQLAAEK